MAAPNPPGSPSPAISGSSSGLKLTLKLGGTSTAASTSSTTTTTSPAPTHPQLQHTPLPRPSPDHAPLPRSSQSGKDVKETQMMLPPPTTSSVSAHSTTTSHRPPPPTSSSLPAPSPSFSHAHAPIPSTSTSTPQPALAKQLPKAPPAPTTPFTDQELKKLEKEFRGVTTDKYRALKKKCVDLTESRDELSLSLFRAQKQIARLREEKDSLLTRVLTLETAAGLSSHEPISSDSPSEEFPLLHPPTLPSLEDRPQKEPIITTSTDLSSASYNAPLGPAPLPDHLPPRLRSQHLRTTIAAQRYRDSVEKVRIAKALPETNWSVVGVLGLKGSAMGEKIERVLAGEEVAFGDQVGLGGNGVGGNKRRRESTSGSTNAKGKGRESSTMSSSLRDLPNPFAFGAGAAPEGTFRGEVKAQEIASQQVAQAAAAVDLARRQAEEAAMASAAAAAAAAELATASPASGVSYDDTNNLNSTNSTDPHQIVPPRRQKTSPQQFSQQQQLQQDVKIKPKRLKTHGITSGNYSIPHIPRNEDGTPVLPLPVGIMILKKLGTVNPKEHFHTERYIFPVGFECMRKYPSMIDRTETVEYTCRIVDGGDGAPRFEIDAADQPGVIIAAGTPTGAWAQIVKAANKIRERNHSNSVSGPDYYGLAQNVIKALIQELPGANRLNGYIWQNFIEDEPAELAPDGKQKKKLVSDKVRGAKRKMSMRADEFGQPKPEFDDDDDMSGGGGVYTSNGGGGAGVGAGAGAGGVYSPSPSIVGRSMSPTGSPAFHESLAGTPSSLSGLLPPTAPNPYSLPHPSLDNSFGQSPVMASSPVFDPYAIPAPGSAYNSPSIGNAQDGGPAWNQGGFTAQPNPYDIGGNFGAFDQPMNVAGGPPYGAEMDRGSNSSSSGDSSN